MLEHILVASGSAYLLVDTAFNIQSVGGRAEILEPAPSAGTSLFAQFPELVGSEAMLHEIAQGERADLHFRYINRAGQDGTVRYFDLLTLPHVEAGGHINGLVQVVTDVTERGSIEQLYVQQRNELSLLKDRMTQQHIDLARTNAELRRASRLKDEFLAGISHEVRTPLSAILGMAELLHTEVLGDLNEEQTDMLKHIDESGRHLLSVINDLLDLAKIDAGQFTLDPHTVLVSELCEASTRMVKHLAMRKGQSVRVQIDPEITFIHADERRLRQALINLLSNAVKFTPSNGHIGLDVTLNREKQTVQFTVWDTGIGIEPEAMTSLFQPFIQIDGTHQREQTGSGLGLTIVARLIELHGGGVGLTSEPGVGSRFTISLPWKGNEPEPVREDSLPAQVDLPAWKTAAQGSLPHAAANESILLIEDDVIGGGVVVDYLEHCGYQMTHAISGEEGLAYVRREQPDAMIVDLRLPGISGLEVIQQMRAREATRSTPIIVLTVVAIPTTRAQCLEAGANVYLSKPVQLRRLASVIAMLLIEQRERYAQQAE